MRFELRTVAAVMFAMMVAGCQLTFEPLNLNTIEGQRAWPENYAGGRVSPPAGR